MIRCSLIVSMIVLVSAVLLSSFVVRGQRPEPPPQSSQEIKPITASAAKPLPRIKRFREGTTFKNMLVFFRQTGEQTVLYTVEDNQRFVCLENLALERILNTMQEKPERQFWMIEGEYTEFRGENRVLIRRAVIARAPPVDAPVAP